MPEFEVDFDDEDKLNPKQWPIWYRGFVIGALGFSTLTTIFYSTGYTSGLAGMMDEFHETSEPIATLGVTTYLTGLACGSLILAPLSEIYGRRPVYIGGMLGFILLILPCALATSLPEIIVVRFFGALMGACTIAMAPGSIADITPESHRALAFSIWGIGPMNGPVVGPLVGGFVYQYLGWRWTNWLVMIMGGASLCMVCCVKETYAPVILQRKAAAIRKEKDDERYWSRYDQKLSLINLLKVNLSRPFILTLTEPILWFWDLYIAVIYGILYLCFVAYPIIFTEIRGWSPSLSGLAFCGIGLGSMIAILSEPLIRRWINSHRDKTTGKLQPEASVSIICVAAVCVPVGQLWFSWTSLPVTIHPVWSILAGIPFGFGNSIVFIYSSNYIAGSYGVYAASALAGNSVVRSFTGGTLPLAGPAMYSALGARWAGTLLGVLELLLIPIPFVFYKWGKGIRDRSPLIKRMREDQERSERKADRAREKRRRAEERGMGIVEVDGEKGGDVEAPPKIVNEVVVEKA